MNFTIETRTVHGQVIEVKVYEKQLSTNPKYTALPTGSTGGKRPSSSKFK